MRLSKYKNSRNALKSNKRGILSKMYISDTLIIILPVICFDILMIFNDVFCIDHQCISGRLYNEFLAPLPLNGYARRLLAWICGAEARRRRCGLTPGNYFLIHDFIQRQSPWRAFSNDGEIAYFFNTLINLCSTR